MVAGKELFQPVAVFLLVFVGFIVFRVNDHLSIISAKQLNLLTLQQLNKHLKGGDQILGARILMNDGVQH